MDDPVVILPDSQSALLERFESPETEQEVASNTTSSGHPPGVGFIGPFLDSVYLHGTAELNAWADELWSEAFRVRGSRFYWPLEAMVVKRTHPACLDEQRKVPEGVRWLATAKYFEGHLKYPVEFCGGGSQLGVRVLLTAKKAGRYTFKVLVSPTVLWALRAELPDYEQVVNWILETITGESVIPGDFPFRSCQLDDLELHSTIDVWGFNWTLEDAENLISLRECSVSVAHSGEASGDPDLDNDQPLYAKRFRQSETIYHGNRGTDHRQLCIYNKTIQSKLNGSNTYLEPKWRAAGWNGTDTVWRMEIRHGKGWLRSHGFTAAEHLKGCEKTLFAKFLEQVRLILRNTSNRARRAKIHPFWLYLRSAILTPSESTWIWKPKAMNIQKDAVRLTQMAVGCTASLIELVQVHSSNLVLDRSKRGIWSPESVMQYERAKDHVLHELSQLIDDKFLNRHSTPDDISATIQTLKSSLAEEDDMKGLS